jgi:hypothetical protein
MQPGRTYRLLVTTRTENYVAGVLGSVVGQALEGGGPFKIEPAR